MYKALVSFFDPSQEKPYEVGDVFPRAGSEVGQDRIDYLLSNVNKTGRPVICWENDPVVFEQAPEPFDADEPELEPIPEDEPLKPLLLDEPSEIRPRRKSRRYE